MRRAGRAYGAALARDLLRVEVHGVLYAIEVSRIREIVNPLQIIELPHERRFILGVSDYRDEVVAVIDLRRLFGLPTEPASRRTKWIILDAGERLVAVVVDAVLDVFSSAEHQERQIPVLDERHRERGIKSAYRHDERLVFLLDAARLAEPAMQITTEELSYLPAEVP